MSVLPEPILAVSGVSLLSYMLHSRPVLNASCLDELAAVNIIPQICRLSCADLVSS